MGAEDVAGQEDCEKFAEQFVALRGEQRTLEEARARLASKQAEQEEAVRQTEEAIQRLDKELAEVGASVVALARKLGPASEKFVDSRKPSD